MLKSENLTFTNDRIQTVGGARGGSNQGLPGAGGRGRVRLDYVSKSGSIGSGYYASYYDAVIPYKTAGTYLSPALDIDGCTSFGTLAWTASGGTVQIRTRTAATQGGLSSATWSGYLTTSGSAITSTPNDWMQYEVSMTGTTSQSPTLSSVTINYITNAPPDAFSLVSPGDNAYLNTSQPALLWQTAIDPEDDPVTYTLKISTDAGFTEPVYRTVPGLSATIYTPGVGDEIANGTYYWKVTATDGSSLTPSNEIWQFTVDTVAPAAPALTATLADLLTGKIVKVIGSGESTADLTLYQWNPGSGQYDAVTGQVSWEGSTFTFDPDSDLDSGCLLFARSEDTATNVTDSRTATILFEAFRDVFRDETFYRGSGPGSSLRLEKDTSYQFRLAVNGGSPATVTAWLYKNGYTGTQPRITLTGLGVSGAGGASDSMSAGNGTWEQLAVSGTPNGDGVLTLTVETFSTADGSAVWIDDVTVSQ